MIQAVISFGLSIIVARNLGIDQFGVYAIATSAGVFITILLDGGFVTLLQRESAQTSLDLSTKKSQIRQYALGYTILITIALSLIAYINPFNQDELTLYAIIFAYSPVVLIALSMSVLRGQGRLARDALLQVIGRLLTAFCVVAFIFYGFDSPSSVLFAQGIGGYILYFVLAIRSRVKPLFFIPRVVFKVAMPLAAWTLSIAIYCRSDLLLCRLFDVQRSDIGAYGVACRLVEALQVFTGPVSIILLRKFRIKEASKGIKIKELLKYTYVALAIGVVICASAFLFSPIIIPMMFGEQYLYSIPLFQVLTVGLIFFIVNTVLFQAFIALEFQRLLMIITALAGIFNVILNVIALPIYGVVACAWISVLTNCLLTFLLRFYLLKQLNK